MMSKSVRTSQPQYEKQTITRFRSLDIDHISAIESLFKKYPFLNERVEIHMPYHKAKTTFSQDTVWLWPKFDKRPVGYLIFIEGFAPCIWYPDRQEGLTFRWLLPPNFCQKGATICLANILAGESTLQVEDLLIYEGSDLWSTNSFLNRWEKLNEFWHRLPVDQPLLAFKTRVVKPLSLSEWQQNYDPSIYWIIQPNHSRAPRWFWKDTITEIKTQQFIPPTLKRSNEVITLLSAKCVPYTKTNLPDIYNLISQDGTIIGFGSISSITLSQELRKEVNKKGETCGFPVEVKWNDGFSKYEIVRILPEGTPISTSTFFHHQYQINAH
jgi:hypothetical protein